MPRTRTPVVVEKVCVNIPVVELGLLDVVIADGFYRNRSDALRRGLGIVLGRLRDHTDRFIERNHSSVGQLRFAHADLERMSHPARFHHVGLLEIAPDVDADLAAAKLGEVSVYGVVRVPRAVLETRRIIEPARIPWLQRYTVDVS